MKLFHTSVFSPLFTVRTFKTSAPFSRHPKTENFLYWEGLDWDRITHFNYYAVIDPVDPREVLYLTEREYKQLVRVALSTETSVLVIAHPGQEKPTDWDVKKTDKLSKISPATYHQIPLKKFWRSAISRIKNLSVKDSMVEVGESLDPLIRRFGNTVALYSGIKVGKGFDVSLRHFSAYSRHIVKHQGVSRYIQLLKVTKFSLECYLAGTPCNPRELGCPMRLSKGGLPLWLPLEVRQAFLARNTKWIRAWLSITNIYRSLLDEYKEPQFDSITSEPFYSDLSSFGLFLRTSKLIQDWKYKFSIKDLVPKVFPLMVTGSGVGPGSSILLSHVAARHWTFQPVNHLLNYLTHVKAERCLEVYKEILNITQPDACNELLMHKHKKTFLGQLHLKYEAAGKIRVFAMVDYWTQLALLPLHQVLFKMLESFEEMDGTFNQEGAVQSLKDAGYEEFYSYDLKSATDLIPQQLYVVVLNEIFGKPFGHLWMSLLVDREFGLPYKDPKKKEYYKHNDLHYVTYTRGQPMGALSSWASMALVHHLIVQFSYMRICPLENITDIFRGYRVLGDDIVIANKEVAEEYLKVCEEFGITIGLAKSLISPKTDRKGRSGLRCFQFANQIVLGLEDVSPISLKEELTAQSYQSKLELVSRMLRRGWCNPTSSRLTFIISRLMPRLWARSHHSMKVGKLPAFVKALLPLLLMPSSLDVGLTGFHKYYAWYQVLTGSYTLADLLNHKSWKSDKKILQIKEFVHFLSEEARKIYQDLIAQHSWGEQVVKTLVPKAFILTPPDGFEKWREKSSQYFNLVKENEMLPPPDSLFSGSGPLLSYEEEVDLSKYSKTELADLLLKPNYKLGYKHTPTSIERNLVKVIPINVNFHNYLVVKEAIKDYITSIDQFVRPHFEPVTSHTKLFESGFGINFKYRGSTVDQYIHVPVDLNVPEEDRKPEVVEETDEDFLQRIISGGTQILFAAMEVPESKPKPEVIKDVWALESPYEKSWRELKKLKLTGDTEEYQPWDGSYPLHPARAPIESIHHTYQRIEMLLTLNSIYHRLKPEDLLKRSLSTPKAAGFTGFTRRLTKIINIASRQLPSHFFAKREEIIPHLPGV